MNMLVAAALTFLAIHLLVSGTRLRDGIVSAIGEGPYLGLYALASLATLVWLAISYNAALMSSESPPHSTTCSPNKSVSVSSLNVVFSAPARVPPIPFAYDFTRSHA